MKIGFTSTTFRNIKKTEDIIAIAKKCNADCIEWGADVHIRDIETAKKTRELCDAAGVESCAYGSYYRVGCNDRNEWKKICQIASVLGAETVRVWLGSADSEKTSENEYFTLVEDIKSMCEVAKQYNIFVSPECHDNTYNNNTDAFLRMYKDVGCDNFGTYFQSRYKKAEYDLDRIERTLPFFKNVHVSYFDMFREQFPQYNPEYMNMLLDKLINSGFDGNILVEFTYPGFKAGFPFCLKKDIAKLRSKLK